MQREEPNNSISQEAPGGPGRGPNTDLTDAQWAALVDRLTRYARQALWHIRKGTGDFDDAVLSTLRTYLRQQKAETNPPSNDPEDLWPLMKEQLKRKIDKLRHQQRYASNNFRRDGDLADPTLADATSAGFLDSRSGPEDVERYIQEALQTAAELIDDESLLKLARLKLESYSTAEIAELLDMSEHKVRRRVSKIRTLLRANDSGELEAGLDD